MMWRSLPFFICFFGISAGQTTTDTINDNGVCGKRIQDDDPERVRVIPTIAGRVPWHVGIYKFNSIGNIFDLICGGTIIAPDIVLTAATCVYDTVSRKTYNPNLFRITAGKLAFNWSSTDSHAQVMTVKEIAVAQKYLEDTNRKADNLALLQLTADFYFNDRVRPICFDLNSSVYNIEDGYLQTAGWGLDGGVSKWPFLKEANFQYLSKDEIIKKFSNVAILRFIAYDDINLLTPGGRTDYDSGGGLVHKKDNKYHLVGIMSDYINNEFSPATNLSEHLTWLNSTMELFGRLRRCKNGFLCLDGTCIDESLVCDDYKDCPDGEDEIQETCPSTKTKRSCLLPNQTSGGNYTKQNCDSKCNLIRGGNVAQNERVQLNCGEGFAPSDIGSITSYVCIQGRWFPEDPKCIKLCSPLKIPNVIFHCAYKGRNVNCNGFMRPGTIVKYSCSEHYRLDGPSSSRRNITCVEGGIWKDPMPKCSPVCGVENQADLVELTVAYGNVTKYGKHPWHVGIYNYSGPDGNSINYCGGTLINENTVLTAAHCLYTVYSVRRKEEELMVAAGKFYRTLDRQEEHQQISPVKKILTPPTYGSHNTQLELDIGLIITEKPFIFNDFVLPACVDYSERLNPLKPNTTGTFVGWGLTEIRVYSEELREVNLPILDNEECRNRFKLFTSYINWDKFCLLAVNASSPNTADAGGGVTIKRQGLHFVHGVSSMTATGLELENLFTIVTNVSSHIEWIKQQHKVYSRHLNKL